ncbi:hypothetical protein OIV83_001830 [Microbotryomycetes sp. JL201]|nr:hypothetical protein OIV83_001830 [Microbotryomycetes sp. JL201]
MAPKRPADSYTAPGSTAQPTTGKRVKFAGNQDGIAQDSTVSGTGDINDALEADLEGPGTNKRVMTAGYDSDSSVEDDDGFGGVGGGRQGSKKSRKDGAQASESAGPTADDEDEDDDMFGDAAAKLDGKGVGDDQQQPSKGKGKQKEFLEMGDIEGQEFGKGDDDDEDEGDDDEELEEDYAPEDDRANDDDAPRSRRSKKGMGFQLSSFNMADELSEGRFTTDGTYVRNAEDQGAKHDAWLNGLSKKAIKAARESKQRMEEEARRREQEANKGEDALTQERDDCMIGLLSLIREGESVSSALNRLGGNRKKHVKRKIKVKGDDMDVDDDGPNAAALSAVNEQPTQAQAEADDPVLKKINRITFFASTLLAQGELEIYSKTYEDILKTLRAEGAVRRDWIPPRDPDIVKEEQEASARAKEEAASGGKRSLIARPSSATAPPPSSTRMYYKWLTPAAGTSPDQEYGPFSKDELHSWIVNGYFGPNAEKIQIKAEGGSKWTTWAEAQSL